MDTLSSSEQSQLDEKFAYAVHASATPFSFFESSPWVDFFKALRATWKLPSHEALGGPLLNRSYEDSMNKAIASIKQAKGGTLGIDGATNVMARSICNVIMHTPLPFFLEYLVSDLQRETAINLKCKLIDVLRRMEEVFGFRIRSFISDSCNLMVRVRNELVEEKRVDWAYGCVAHALNNFCEDIGKLKFSTVLKEALFVSKTIRNKHLLRKLYEVLCEEKLGKPYAMVLYSKTRWSSVNFMLQRVLETKSVLAHIPLSVVADLERLKLDEDIDVPQELTQLVTSKQFWDRVQQASLAYDPICTCIGVCESDTSTMATAFASLLFVRVHIRQAEWITTSEKNRMQDSLTRQAGRMLSDVHYLAFVCDPFWTSMRGKVADICGADFLQFDGTSVSVHCHRALKMLSRNEEHYEKLLAQFMQFTIESDTTLCTLQDWHPRLLWGQADAQFAELARTMVEIFQAPASAAGIERNHKMNKQVHTALRSRLGNGKVEKQVAIAHNEQQHKRPLKQKRAKCEYYLREAARLASSSQIQSDGTHDGRFGYEDEGEGDEHMEALLAIATGPESISDSTIFSDLTPLSSDLPL